MSTPPAPTAPLSPVPVGPQLAPLVAVRDASLFEQWWNAAPNQATLAEDVAAIPAGPDALDIEWSLQSLMLSVIQSDPEGVNWLALQGLNAAATVRWLGLDLDPSYDTDGKLNGTNVALSAHVALPDDQGLHFLYETVYVEHPGSVLMPAGDDPREVIAELVDRALGLINHSLAERDELTVARQQITAPTGVVDLTEKTVRDVVNAAADEVIAVAELPATGARDALNLMANIVLHWLFEDRSASVPDVVAESYNVSLDEVLSWIDS
jgi:hypothetical protein